MKGVGFQMSEQKLRTTLGVLYNISGQRFQYATQQVRAQPAAAARESAGQLGRRCIGRVGHRCTRRMGHAACRLSMAVNILLPSGSCSAGLDPVQRAAAAGAQPAAGSCRRGGGCGACAE